MNSKNTRTLYLDGKETVRVMLDGPTLRVRKPVCADMLFPLSKLNSVVVCGQVQWDTQALIACATMRVNISFISRKGKVIAHVRAPVCKQSIYDVNSALQQFFELACAGERYNKWLRVREYLLMRKLSIEMQIPFRYFADRQVTLLIKKKLGAYISQPDFDAFCGRVFGFMQIKADSQLIKSGIDTDAHVFKLDGIQLQRNFASFAYLSMAVDILRYLKHACHRNAKNGGNSFHPQYVEAVRFIEKYHNTIAQVIDRHMRLLQIFVLDELQENAG